LTTKKGKNVDSTFLLFDIFSYYHFGALAVYWSAGPLFDGGEAYFGALAVYWSAGPLFDGGGICGTKVTFLDS